MTSPMKIALISPNKTHLSELSLALDGAGHATIAVEGGRSRLPQVLAEHRPDLVLIDGMCCDPDELDAVEQATAQQPQLAVLLMCAQHSAEFLMRAMRAGVREVLPSPAPVPALLAAVQRIEGKRPGARAAGRGRLLAFMACKGGSGATFIATQLGQQLAAQHRVLLIDLNLQFGDALLLAHDKPPPFTLADVARDIARLDASLLSACAVPVTPSFSVLAAPEDFAEALEVRSAHVDAIVQAALQHHDFVLLDLGRNLDPLNLRMFDLADRIFLVMQAALPDIRHARRLQKALRALDCPADKLEWIVNRHDKAADIGLEEIARALGGQRLRTVANSYREVQAAVNQGAALGALSRSGAVTRSLAELALSLTPRQDVPPSLLGRLFRRA